MEGSIIREKVWHWVGNELWGTTTQNPMLMMQRNAQKQYIGPGLWL